MKEHAFRLTKGQDLKKSICAYCLEHKIDTAVVVSSVGCLDHYKVRLAKAIAFKEEDLDVEILSLNGTISKGKAHLHLAVSDENGNCIGGHLSEGSIVNTTCEVVLLELEDYCSRRVFDESTGYDEILFERK